ncbi:beta-lactamase domain protein [Acetobacter orientalis]|uniref:Beta-lactamase domain protein n=1 Tax=Acetobacter orientalis TaxID=146474 RepID=A0A2Z5ZED1_9PROT|nr:beta-lactamase domain protein [Acetobacter orientalis]
MHKTTVSNWANTNRHVSDALLDILDLERVTLYRPKKALQNGQGAHNG